MNKHVVTGGAGFIGSALVRGLLRNGAGKVVVIDNLLTGHEENLEEVASSVELHKADICHYDQIEPIVRGADSRFPRGRNSLGAPLDRRSRGIP